jgi:hypothetical protein
VSLASQRRRLQRLEKVSGPKEPTLEQVVMEVERPYAAARSVTAFARALAGTDRLQAPPVSPSLVSKLEENPSPVRLAPSPKTRPAWTKDVRPGPHDVLTWEEAMQVPWIDGTSDER